MRILQVLTYYRPHISGLTIYAERLSRGLVRAGHSVTVMTSQYDKSLPLEDEQDGVRIVRVPVAFRMSKGVIMPAYGVYARRLMRTHDIVHAHLPQFDGAGLAISACLYGKPSVLTYHCDIQLPPALLNRIVHPVINGANHLAAIIANRLVAYTDDYAENSPYLSRYLKKVTVIPPPIEIEPPQTACVTEFAQKWHIQTRPVIGMVARLATEKGVEVLVDAMDIVRRTLPDARVLFAGQYQNVLGEEGYARRLQPRFAEIGSHWSFTGPLLGQELSALYANCDVTVLPSLNSTESFGLVQVESMYCGTPSICSNLPGVRVPIQTTGMGKVTPIGDAPALANAIIEVVQNRNRYVKNRDDVAAMYSTGKTVAQYEVLYRKLVAEKMNE